MIRALRDLRACREALARLPELDLTELRQQWRTLYKSDASPHLCRELLLRASGHTHTVLVREDGFEYDGQRYRSQISAARFLFRYHTAVRCTASVAYLA